MLYLTILGILFLLGLLAWLLSLRKSNQFHTVQKFMDEEKYDDAVLKLNAMIEDATEVPRAYLYLAQCHEKLGSSELARSCYRKAIELGAVEDKEREIEIYRKIIESYRAENNYNSIFETNLEILRLDPEDEFANQEVGLLALGDGGYAVAEIYLKRALEKSNELELIVAYAVTQYQMGESSLALQTIEDLVDQGISDFKAPLLFATMAITGKYLAKGKGTTLELLKQTNDANSKELLLNTYLYQCAQAKAWREAIAFLAKWQGDGSLPSERRRDYLYLLLLLYLHEEMFLEASRLFREIDTDDAEYKDMRHLKVFIDQIELKPHADNLKPFDAIFEENFSALVKVDTPYTLSGFRRNRGISLNKFFDMSRTPPELRLEYGILTAEKSGELFVQMSTEDFQRFALSVIMGYGYNEPVKEASGERDLLLYSTIAAKNKSIRALFAFYRVRSDSHISDISIRNLQTKMHQLKADKTYIVSPAEFTEGANALVAVETSIQAVTSEKVIKSLHDFIKTAAR